MKNNSTENHKGSVLIIAMFTITILVLICATSLFVTSQNTSTVVQTAAWQQALTGAEMGIDAGVRALNQNSSSSANPWTNWKYVTCATGFPTPAPSASPVAGYTYEPTPTGNASGLPTSGQYNYLPSNAPQMTVNYPSSEGTTSVSAWVTIDTAGGISNSNGTWYRIRSTGQATFKSNSVYKRVSNNRLDNDLRNTLALNFNRKGNANPGPTRTIEVVVQPLPKGGAGPIALANYLQMSGGGLIDAFSSPDHQWSSAYRDLTNPLLVTEGATGGKATFANTGQTYVYGGVSYSGTAPTNVNADVNGIKDVTGQVSTPAVVSLPAPTDPTAVSGQSGHYTWTYSDPWAGTTTNYTFNSSTAYTGGNSLPKDSNNNTVTSITASGTASNPGLIVISSGFTVSGGNTFTINPTTTGNPPVADPTNSYVIIWVQGKYTTSGSAIINQVSGTNVKWIIDGDITVSGNTYNNANGTAASNAFIGVGTNNKFTDSGSANFTGTLNAPAYDSTISGGGYFTGAIASSTLNMSGGSGFHYDESLTPNANPSVGNYAFASWFEDNSQPTHKDIKGNYIVY